jgi:hypothetical protein
MRSLPLALAVALLATACLGAGSSASHSGSSARPASRLTLATQLLGPTRRASDIPPGSSPDTTDNANLRWRTRAIATISCAGPSRAVCSAAADLARRDPIGHSCFIDDPGPVRPVTGLVRLRVDGVVDGRRLALVLLPPTCSHSPRVQRELRIVERAAGRYGSAVVPEAAGSSPRS